MKRNKSTIFIGAVVLSLLLITSSASVILATEQENDNKVKIDIRNEKPASEQMVREIITDYQIREPIKGPDQPVTSLEEDEYNPAIGVDPDEEYMLAYVYEEDIIENHIFWKYSTDGGQTWSPDFGYILTGTESHPSLDYQGLERRFSGILQGDPTEGNGAVSYAFSCTDPTDTNTYELSSVDWSSSYPYADRRIPDIGAYGFTETSEPDWWWGLTAVVGTRDVRVDMPIFNYPNYELPDNVWSNYWEGYQGCENAAIDVDTTNGNFYAVFDYYPTGATDWDLVVFRGSCYNDGDNSLTHYSNGVMGDEENTKYPAIGANKDYVQIVCQSDEGGSQDIVCYYSSDAGLTWEKSVVADSGDDEVFPAIVTIGAQAKCTYQIDGDLYYSNTTDGGVTWSAPKQINDEAGTVNTEFREVDITYDGTVVWTDDRAGNLDIYLDNVGVFVVPYLKITSFSGGLGVSVVLGNEGTGEATNVNCTMTVKGGILNMINKTVTKEISSIAIDANSDPIKSGLLIGLGAISVSVSVTCAEGVSATGSKDGTQLLIFTLL